jgi:DNA-binding MarR family transcriptional regulator
MSLTASSAAADPRLILREEELDAAIEVFVLAEAAFWASADEGLGEDMAALGRGHYRAALFLKRRPGIGVQDLSRLTGLSKQAASKAIKDLIAAGYATSDPDDLDARRRPTRLTPAGEAFEGKVSVRLREHLARAYRDGGLDAAPGARRILAAIAGPRAAPRRDTGL